MSVFYFQDLMTCDLRWLMVNFNSKIGIGDKKVKNVCEKKTVRDIVNL